MHKTKRRIKLIKRNIAALFVVIIFCMGALCSCKDSNAKNGKFYPYDLTKYVELGDYENISYEKKEVSVTEEDIDNYIKSELVRFNIAELEKKDAMVAEGDTVNIDYVGYIKGKTFEGGSAEGASLVIGSGQFIDGFESGLIGAYEGEKVSLPLKFPDTYHVKEFAGKSVLFEVTVNAVYNYVYPELTDDIVVGISTSKSVEDYKLSIKNTLTEKETEKVYTSNHNAFIDAVIKSCDIKKLPSKEVDRYKTNLIKQYENTASSENLTLEMFVSYNGFTMDSFEKEMENTAELLVKKEIVFLLIADKENITLTNEEYEKGLSEHMHNNGYTSRTSFLNAVGEENFKGILRIEKAIDTLKEKVG